MLALYIRNEEEFNMASEKMNILGNQYPGIYVPVHDDYVYHDPGERNFLEHEGHTIVCLERGN